MFKDTNGKFYLKDQATWDQVKNCEFKKVFPSKEIQTLAQIRERVANG